MIPQLALLGTILYVAGLLHLESKRQKGLSAALWLVVIWIILIGSRPVSSWFSSGAVGVTQAGLYDEGSPLDRISYSVLIVAGVTVLHRRRVRFSEVVSCNRWLAVFFMYWTLSILWSDAPGVAFRRLVKDLGNVVMVLVILTERNPWEACMAAFVRAGCVLIPISVVLIRFYPDLGRMYHPWNGELMFTGVATHKNTLGVNALACGFFMMAALLHRKGQRAPGYYLASDIILALVTAWVLVRARSATALCCFAGCSILYVLPRLRVIRKRAQRFGWYFLIAAPALWLLNSVFDIWKWVVVDMLGRDMTLTTRTEVWPQLLAQSQGVFLGSGFNSFWSGERLALIYDKLGIIQAHSGYLETYLNGGLIAIILLCGVLASSLIRIQGEIARGEPMAMAQLAIVLTVVLYNVTEAAYNKMGLIWFLLLVAIMRYQTASYKNRKEAWAEVVKRKQEV